MGSSGVGSHTYAYPRPALTVDVVVVAGSVKREVLLIKRGGEPFAGCWALPGGFVEELESLATAARRELKEETGIEVDGMEQLYTAGDAGRDPRGWTVSVVFLARLAKKKRGAKAADDATDAAWFPLDELPAMAFDHGMILARAAARLRDRAE